MAPTSVGALRRRCSTVRIVLSALRRAVFPGSGRRLAVATLHRRQIERRFFVDRQFAAEQTFDCKQMLALVAVAERNGNADGAGTARAADSMHINFRLE